MSWAYSPSTRSLLNLRPGFTRHRIPPLAQLSLCSTLGLLSHYGRKPCARCLNSGLSTVVVPLLHSVRLNPLMLSLADTNPNLHLVEQSDTAASSYLPPLASPSQICWLKVELWMALGRNVIKSALFPPSYSAPLTNTYALFIGFNLLLKGKWLSFCST